MKSELEFWSKTRPAGGNCWEWTGGTDTRGYGHLRWFGQPMRAHRLAYMLECGEIPEGEGHHGTVVMHTCDNRLCCNPAHLKLGTHAENMADMKAKARRKGIGAGERNGRAVLTAEQAHVIRNDPRSINVLAAIYPVSRAAIQRIKAGKAWADDATLLQRKSDEIPSDPSLLAGQPLATPFRSI